MGERNRDCLGRLVASASVIVSRRSRSPFRATHFVGRTIHAAFMSASFTNVVTTLASSARFRQCRSCVVWNLYFCYSIRLIYTLAMVIT